MIFRLYTMKQDYEELLEATKKEKQTIKKSIPKLEKLKGQNAELGIETAPLDEKIADNVTALDNINKEIVKYKKVIHRLGVCIAILKDEEVEEQEPTEENETIES